MTKDKKAFKFAPLTETAACELCHIRFVFKDIVRHVKSNPKDIETVQSLYKIKPFNSIIKCYKVSILHFGCNFLFTHCFVANF